MKTKYSQEFRDQAVQKLLQRGDKTIGCIAVELNINIFTLKHWLDEAAIAENILPNSHLIKQLKFNLKPSIRGIV